MDTKTKRGAMARVPGLDILTAEEAFKAAMLLVVPENQSQRKAVATLMPYLYVLRNKGCSWPQLAKLLGDCGIKLQPSTVRNYFGELLATRMDMCQERMNEQILVLAELRKETKGADMSAIFGRVSAAIDKQRPAVGLKIDAMLGIGPADNIDMVAGSGREKFTEPASPALKKADAGLRPALEKPKPQPQQKTQTEPTSDDEEMGSFGLLSAGNTNVNAGKPVFFSMDDDAPSIPDLTVQRAAPEQTDVAALPQYVPQRRTLTCRPLPSGVKPLQKRANVFASVYEPGDMEHPAIKGVMLSLDQRLCSVSLEFVDEHGEIRLETSEEKRLRIFWIKPVFVTSTMTAGSFTRMDEALFSKKSV